MTTFYICRHGQSENNKNKRLSGWLDSPLTEQGIKDAGSSGKKLSSVKFDRAFSSDLGRAFITAYLVLKQNSSRVDIELAKGLREVNYGELANQPYSAYPSMTLKQKNDYAPPGGESLAQMQQRVLGCIGDIAQSSPGKTILLVAHDGTINAVYAKYSDQAMAAVDAAEHPHDFVAKFTLNDGVIDSFVEI